MDRNTLLAFFLIALVLLFTPKYMEVFAPQTTTNEDTSLENLKEDSLGTSSAIRTQEPQLAIQKKENPVDNKHEAKITSIETDLYTAKVSSINGGSIQSFLLKEFLIYLDGHKNQMHTFLLYKYDLH